MSKIQDRITYENLTLHAKKVEYSKLQQLLEMLIILSKLMLIMRLNVYFRL